MVVVAEVVMIMMAVPIHRGRRRQARQKAMQRHRCAAPCSGCRKAAVGLLCVTRKRFRFFSFLFVYLLRALRALVSFQ